MDHFVIIKDTYTMINGAIKWKDTQFRQHPLRVDAPMQPKIDMIKISAPIPTNRYMNLHITSNINQLL